MATLTAVRLIEIRLDKLGLRGKEAQPLSANAGSCSIISTPDRSVAQSPYRERRGSSLSSDSVTQIFLLTFDISASHLEPPKPKLSTMAANQSYAKVPNDEDEENYNNASAVESKTPNASLANSPMVAILSYCGSSILMTVTNKYVLGGRDFNLNFFLLCVQVCCIYTMSTGIMLILRRV